MIPFLEDLETDEINIRVLIRTRKHLIFTAMSGLVMILLIWFVIWPQSMQLWQTYGDVRDAREDLADLERRDSTIAQLNTERILIESEQINQTLPTGKPLQRLLSTLDQVIDESAVELTEISASPGIISSQSGEATDGNSRRIAENYDTLDLNIVIAGQLREINRFLSSMESVAPVTNATELTLSDRDQAATELSTLAKDFQAEVTLTTYFYSGDVEEVTLRTTLPRITGDEIATLNEIQDLEFYPFQQQTDIRAGNVQDLFESSLQ